MRLFRIDLVATNSGPLNQPEISTLAKLTGQTAHRASTSHLKTPKPSHPERAQGQKLGRLLAL